MYCISKVCTQKKEGLLGKCVILYEITINNNIITGYIFTMPNNSKWLTNMSMNTGRNRNNPYWLVSVNSTEHGTTIARNHWPCLQLTTVAANTVQYPFFGFVLGKIASFFVRNFNMAWFDLLIQSRVHW